MKLERAFKDLQQFAAREIPVPLSVRDFHFKKLAEVVEKLENSAGEGRERVRPDVLAKWARYVDGKAIEFSPYEVRQLCWHPPVAHSPAFRRILNSPEALLSKALEGLGFCLHMGWESGENTELIRSILDRELGRNRLSRRLLIWRDHRALLLDAGAAERLGDELFSSCLPVDELFRGYRLIGESELAQSAVGHALALGSRNFDRLTEAQRKYVFLGLLQWKLLSKEALQSALAGLIVAPGLSSDKALQKVIIDMVLNHPSLKDPRVYPHNWDTTAPLRKAAAVFTAWLSVEDIRIFFEVLLGTKEDPHRRRRFWLEYVGHVHRSRVFVSQEDRVRRRGQLAQLEQDGRTFGELKGATSAFILFFKNYVVVEFSEVGNAAYVYEVEEFNKMFPAIFSRTLIDVGTLKNRKKAKARIIRQPPDRWEIEARSTLVDLQIYRSRDD